MDDTARTARSRLIGDPFGNIVVNVLEEYLHPPISWENLEVFSSDDDAHPEFEYPPDLRMCKDDLTGDRFHGWNSVLSTIRDYRVTVSEYRNLSFSRFQSKLCDFLTDRPLESLTVSEHDIPTFRGWIDDVKSDPGLNIILEYAEYFDERLAKYGGNMGRLKKFTCEFIESAIQCFIYNRFTGPLRYSMLVRRYLKSREVDYDTERQIYDRLNEEFELLMITHDQQINELEMILTEHGAQPDCSGRNFDKFLQCLYTIHEQFNRESNREGNIRRISAI